MKVYSLLLVDVRDVALLGLLDNDLYSGHRSGTVKHSHTPRLRRSRGQLRDSTHRDPVGILVPDPASFRLPSLCKIEGGTCEDFA